MALSTERYIAVDASEAQMHTTVRRIYTAPVAVRTIKLLGCFTFSGIFAAAAFFTLVERFSSPGSSMAGNSSASVVRPGCVWAYELRIGNLPQKEVAYSHFARSANKQIGIGDIGGIKALLEQLFGKHQFFALFMGGNSSIRIRLGRVHHFLT